MHSSDGLDEISVEASTYVWEVCGEPLAIKEYEISPADFGLGTHALSTVLGGSAEERTKAFRDVLAGGSGPIRDFIIINAAAGLRAGGIAPTFLAAADIVRAALDSGAAQKVVDKYIALTHEVSAAPRAQTPGGTPMAPPKPAQELKYTTLGGIAVARTQVDIVADTAVETMIDALDTSRGMLMSSSYEYAALTPRTPHTPHTPASPLTWTSRAAAPHAC